MLYFLFINLVDYFSFLNVFKYLTVRTGLAMFTSMIIVFASFKANFRSLSCAMLIWLPSKYLTSAAPPMSL